METNKELAQIIIDYRKVHGLSISELARQLECTRGSLYYWEQGKGNPSDLTLHKMCELFGVEMWNYVKKNFKVETDNWSHYIRVYAILKGFDVPSLSIQLETQSSTVRRWYSGKQLPNANQLLRLENALQEPTSRLVYVKSGNSLFNRSI